MSIRDRITDFRRVPANELGSEELRAMLDGMAEEYGIDLTEDAPVEDPEPPTIEKEASLTALAPSKKELSELAGECPICVEPPPGPGLCRLLRSDTGISGSTPEGGV